MPLTRQFVQEVRRMLVDLAPGWKTHLDRGPDWLIVKLYGPDGDKADATGLAECLHAMMRQEFKERLLLELDEIRGMPGDFVRELCLLHEELESRGAILRLCGMSAEDESRLCERDASVRFAHYHDREEAITGFFRPGKPR
jgi:hypothetical protein